MGSPEPGAGQEDREGQGRGRAHLPRRRPVRGGLSALTAVVIQNRHGSGRPAKLPPVTRSRRLPHSAPPQHAGRSDLNYEVIRPDRQEAAVEEVVDVGRRRPSSSRCCSVIANGRRWAASSTSAGAGPVTAQLIPYLRTNARRKASGPGRTATRPRRRPPGSSKGRRRVAVDAAPLRGRRMPLEDTAAGTFE